MTYHQTTSVPKQTNHTFHLIMTLFTCGMWAFVWAGVAIYNSVAKDKHVTTGVQPPPVYSPGVFPGTTFSQPPSPQDRQQPCCNNGPHWYDDSCGMR